MADYLVMAEDLAEFPMEEVVTTLKEIGQRPRKEYETAFPDIGTLLEPLKSARAKRRSWEAQEHEMQKYRDYAEQGRQEETRWQDLPEYHALQAKINAVGGSGAKQAHTREEIQAAIAASKEQRA